MANPEFKYAPMFQLGPDKTEYRLLTKEGVSVGEFEGKEILKVTSEALTRLAQEAFHDVEFKLRREHNLQVAAILNDPEASENDKYVALQFLRNAETAVKGVLRFCQDTGTAIIHGEKGQQVWTGFEDEEALSLGVYNTFTQDNLRYSQNAPLNMYDEVNTKCNLPAQIDIEAVEGAEYRFVMVAKGGGSANKTYFYPMTKATIQNEGTLLPFLVEKMKTLGTAACPPYHIAFVIGGTSAEKNLLTVKLASIKYYDNLPTTGDETGRAFRDIDLEEKLLVEAQKIGMGAQFGGKYLAHDIRVIRLPRHGASLVMIAKGNRGQVVTDACQKHGGFYLGTIGGVAAVLSQSSIKSIECVEYPELGMEAIWKITVEDFPAFILVDDKGNDFFKEIAKKSCACCK